MKSWKRNLILLIANALCKSLHWTYRYRVFNPEMKALAESFHPRQSWIIASWHQNCFAGIMGHAGQRIALLVSRSFDGEIVSAVAGSLGISSVRGSSKKGGQEAIDQLVLKTKDGVCAAFTVDGPKGPPFLPKRGVFQLAAASGAPVLPVLAIGKQNWVLHKSWDKLRIPKPFTQVTVLYGKPFLVTRDDYETNLPELTQRLTQVLQGLEEDALAAKIC